MGHDILKHFRCLFSLEVKAAPEEEEESGPRETEKEENRMRSQMLCELQRVKKEMVDNSTLVSKPEV